MVPEYSRPVFGLFGRTVQHTTDDTTVGIDGLDEEDRSGFHATRTRTQDHRMAPLRLGENLLGIFIKTIAWAEPVISDVIERQSRRGVDRDRRRVRPAICRAGP